MRLELLNRPVFRSILRRVGAVLATLLVITWLTMFGLILAERGRAGLPARPPEAAIEALGRTAAYVVNHPATYYWHKLDVSAPDLVMTLFGHSAGLLLAALGIAAVVGVPLGMGTALSRRPVVAPLALLLSILGISTPSFLLAMLFWVINIQVARQMGMDSAPLPVTGFGWDAHLVLPALVLAARPLAQVVQVTYETMSGVLREDYFRTAQSKGLPQRMVLGRHALRNVLIPILTTLGTSLRFSLASLPVVEYFFVWPGVGLTLLQAIESGTSQLVTDLIVSLGFLFLLINLSLEMVYQIVDPRLRGNGQAQEQLEERQTWREQLTHLKDALVEWWGDVLVALRLRRQPSQLVPLPAQIVNNGLAASDALPAPSSSRRYILRNTLGNPTLVIGTVLLLAFFGVAFFGEQLTRANPGETHGTMMVEGQLKAAPFLPSSVFPWGSDMIGRDIQALVLAGAKQTLALALAGMAARVLLGTVLGLLAGWWRGSWLDKLVTGAVGVWAAFPVTLFAMILILALGIQQGRSVFIVALCVVGWGETAQFVRGQVISLKPQPYIEAARAAGARSGRILSWHILPQLLPSLLVVAVLEMGGILMLLAELGFLNIFLGGGFKVELTSEKVFHYSDVPEWGALLANIRNWWRSYPWMAWYPGLAFFATILGFNLWGDGLRRLLEATRINVSRLLNRYTVVAASVLVIGLVWVLRSTAPIEAYQFQARQFDARRAMEDIRVLSSSQLQGDVSPVRLPQSDSESQALPSGQFDGREPGTPGTRLAAEYIARRMQEVGLSPAGDAQTYIQTFVCSRNHLVEVPRLEMVSGQGGITQSLTYRQDFAEYVHLLPTFGDSQGMIIGMALGPDPETSGADIYSLNNLGLGDKIVIMREPDMLRVNIPAMAGALFVGDDPIQLLGKKYLLGGDETVALRRNNYKSRPVMYVTPEAADRLLATAGSSLAELDSMAKGLQPGRVALTGTGTTVRIRVAAKEPEDPPDSCYNVIGFIPGAGSEMAGGRGKGLDARVIVVSAYYDGLGVGPDGTFYPGANDNASGVAAMLEMARVLKQSTAQPNKTIVFVAWSGGERRESLSLANVMNAKAGFGLLRVETVIELSGVGAGDGQGIALGQGSSFQLVQTVQEAAGRLGVATTTRGRGPHFGLYTKPAFGGRSALTAYMSWDGSDRTAHTPDDTFDKIEPDKLRQVGQTALLVVSVLSQGKELQETVKPLTTAADYVQGARMFDEQQAIQHIEYLAGDELAGRGTGTPGAKAAADYVAAHFAEYGLQPAGLDSTYFQSFTLPLTGIVELPVLTVTPLSGQKLDRTYAYRNDYLARTRGYMGGGEAEGQVVWLYKCRSQDLADQNLANKVVLCHSPGNLKAMDEMVTLARKQQVGGLLMLVRDKDTAEFRRGSIGLEPATIPAYYITDAVAQDLVMGSGYTLDELSQRSVATPLSVTVHMAVTIQERLMDAYNVLGILPGSDPQHRDEIVIIGAHLDHMGRDPDGGVYHGANDNASGVAAMLEIARLWHTQGFRPARSVLFAAWDGEEYGLKGSSYYVQNPVYPLTSTVAALILDMTGEGEKLYINGDGAAAAQLQASARVYSVTTTLDPIVAGSDHVPFYQVGIPAAIASPYLDSDLTYHTTDDTIQTIQPGALRMAGVLAAHTLAAWSGGGPTLPVPAARRYLWDWIVPTPMCIESRPPGSMTCDHGRWSR